MFSTPTTRLKRAFWRDVAAYRYRRIKKTHYCFNANSANHREKRAFVVINTLKTR